MTTRIILGITCIIAGIYFAWDEYKHPTKVGPPFNRFDNLGMFAYDRSVLRILAGILSLLGFGHW